MNILTLLYNFLISPLWDSIGVIFSVIFVFFGAWIGANLGMKNQRKLNEEQTREEAEQRYKTFRREVITNEMTFNQMKTFLDVIDFPCEKSFSAIKVAAKHIVRGSWDEFAKVGYWNYSDLSEGDRKLCLEYDNSMSHAHRNIEMDIADWERILSSSITLPESFEKMGEIRKNISKNIDIVINKIQLVQEHLRNDVDAY